MGRIGFPELLVVVFIILLILGADHLPALGRSMVRAVRHLNGPPRNQPTTKRSRVQ